MKSDPARRPRGWRIRIAILWAGVLVIAAAGAALLYSYGVRVVAIDQAYLDSELRQSEIDAIDQQWVVASLLAQIAAPLLSAALLLAVLTLAIQARGWRVMQARARVRRADPLEH